MHFFLIFSSLSIFRVCSTFAKWTNSLLSKLRFIRLFEFSPIFVHCTFLFYYLSLFFFFLRYPINIEEQKKKLVQKLSKEVKSPNFFINANNKDRIVVAFEYELPEIYWRFLKILFVFAKTRSCPSVYNVSYIIFLEPEPERVLPNEIPENAHVSAYQSLQFCAAICIQKLLSQLYHFNYAGELVIFLSKLFFS